MTVGTRLHRRGFLRALLGTALGMPGLVACAPERDYREEDARRLAEQKRRERERSGRGPYGPLRFRGYRGLAELPYFELDGSGTLRVAVELPPVLDLHAHLGMALLLAPAIDLGRRSGRVRYMLDCDAHEPGCELDLDVYVNANFTESELAGLRWEVARQFLWGSQVAATHTIPNLLDEMDAVGVSRAAILPIAFGLPFGDDLTERWMDAIQEARFSTRLLPGASVHPRDPQRIEKLRRYAQRGARVVKLHPAGQRFYADDDRAMDIYAECERLGLPVVFHAGRAGIEPQPGLNYNLMRHLAGAVEAFPRVQFVLGHGGARDSAEAVALARRHPHVWLGSHGQGVTRLHEILAAVGPERIVFGTDWPWYHLAASLAKVLLVTEGSPEARAAILGANAERVFAEAARTARGPVA